MQSEEELSFETFFLPMEDGTEQEFAIMDEFAFEGKNYILVSPVTDDTIEDEVVMYRYEPDGDEMIINYIEDENEYQRAAAAYDALS